MKSDPNLEGGKRKIRAIKINNFKIRGFYSIQGDDSDK